MDPWEGKDTAEKEPGGLVWGAQEPRVAGENRQGSLNTLGHVRTLP